MANDKYKQLYDAQVTEHEKTHDRMRALEKENINLRSLINSQQREYVYAVSMLQGIADDIDKVFPREQTNDGR